MFYLWEIVLIAGILIMLKAQDISITVKYVEPYTISCEFEELNKQVTWLYNNVSVFTCDPPYRSGQCNVRDRNYIYNINSYTKTMSVITTKENIMNWKARGDSWTCKNGENTKTYVFNDKDSPYIVSLVCPVTILSVNEYVSITVNINSSEPYTAIWRSQRRGEIETQSLSATTEESSISITSDCHDNIDIFTCVVENGVSFPTSETFAYKVKCETMILEDEMNKTVEVDIGNDAAFTLLYTGDTEPSNVTWYRRMASSLKFLSDYRIKRVSDHETHSISLIVSLVQEQDAGTYTAELYSQNKKTLIDFELKVKTGEGTTDPPFNGYIGIGIGAAGGIVLCVVIVLASKLIQKVLNKEDDYLSPDPVPSTPPHLPPISSIPPPVSTSDASVYNNSVYADSAFDDTYEHSYVNTPAED